MKLDGARLGHLTYCTNIHPGERWPEVRANLHRYLPAIKRAVAPDRALGVGLRLSAAAADGLAAPGEIESLRAFLAAEDLYVFTLNGFPYGPFHGVPVKERVYEPDWRRPERLAYTNRLADLLAALLPADPTLEGSVSTVPGAFKPNATTPQAVAAMVENLLRHAAHLVALRARSGRSVALALEPEPCCFLETIEEAVAFFRDHLFAAAAVRRLGELTGLDEAEASAALRRHLGLCLDVCHAAVEFEDPAEAVRRLREAGIAVAKLQLSAALRVPEAGAGTLERLRAFDDAVYLHQVVAREGRHLIRHLDLPQAFAAVDGAPPPQEWRVHFHVPIFLEDLGDLATTQPVLAAFLELHRESPISAHLEVETYSWGVLPERFRSDDVVANVVRELAWVKDRLAP